jgi:autotransporter-associated beta strand protein
VAGGSGYQGGANGSSLGSAIFLQGDETQTFGAASGETLSISGVIADESGSTVNPGDGTGSGSGTIVIDGAGTVALDAGNSFTGGVTIESDTLLLGAAGAAGTGDIVFGAGDPPGLAFSIADAPANTIQDFYSGDVIDITDLPNSGQEVLRIGPDGVLDIGYGPGETLALTFGSVLDGVHVTLSSDGASGTVLTDQAVCYLRGTRILTSTGAVPVEDLQAGDQVVTRFGAIQTIRWIGRQSYDPRFVRNNTEKLPVRIAAGALGTRLPARDLWVSPGHSMLCGDVLVLARDLVNGVTVMQGLPEDEAAVDYYQLDLGLHDCVLAEGAWSETYADAPGLRAQFHNVAEFAALYPDEAPAMELALCAARPERGKRLEAALRPVMEIAAAAAAPGVLEGYLDVVEDFAVQGWARDVANPMLPVLLEVWLGDELLGTALAREERLDLALEGKGDCGFTYTPPRRLAAALRGALRVCRAVDGAELGWSDGLRARLEAVPAAPARIRLVA